MFHFFRKKELDPRKAQAFVDWFFDNEERIRRSVENRVTDRNTMLSVLDEVEAQLAKVYRDGYSGSIEFDYGGQDREWELNLYHKNHPFLKEAAACIAVLFAEKQNPLWTINTGA